MSVAIERFMKKCATKLIRSTQEQGYAPTTRELAEQVGIKATHGVVDHLWALRRKGYVEWEDGKARTLRVLKMADGRVVGKAGAP